MRQLLFALLAVAAVRALPAHAGLEAGASTFESARRLYAPAPIDESAVRVPQVQPARPLPEVAAGPAEQTFRVERYDVVGNTLLEPERIDAALAPFRKERAALADVEGARDALQQLYADEGLLTVAVVLPQQTIERGVVRLEVVEARLGDVSYENAGVDWYGRERLRQRTAHLRSGAILREDDLRADLVLANAHPDARVRPVLKAGKVPGTVDLTLVVEDQIPLHGSFEWSNLRTAESPRNRGNARVSYGDVWGLEHALELAYQFAPGAGSEVEVGAGTYRMPMPWDSSQSLLAYVVHSDSENGVVGVGGLNLLGKRTDFGARYVLPLPALPGNEWFTHSLALGFDHKDVENKTRFEGEVLPQTPITYMPAVASWSGSAQRAYFTTSGTLGLSVYRAGWVSGGDVEDFQANRGGPRPGNPVDGDYEIVNWRLGHLTALTPLLRTLAAGRFIDVTPYLRGYDSDWSLSLDAFGQRADQPLIPSEQFTAGGITTVRGYLESERFGDDGAAMQLELRTPFLRRMLWRNLPARAQALAFYDRAWLFTQNPGEGESSDAKLYSYGFGLRADVANHLRGELLLSFPMVDTESTNNEDPRVHFRVSTGF